MKFIDRVGEYVRQEGKESIYHCNDCDTNGLNINEQEGQWYCFGCGYGGKTRGIHLGIAPSFYKNEWIFTDWEGQAIEYESNVFQTSCPPVAPDVSIRGVTNETLKSVSGTPLLTRAYGIPGCRFTIRNIQSNNITGYQYYYPGLVYMCVESTYRTFGTKGWVYDRHPKGSTCIFIFEGIFDLLAYKQQYYEGCVSRVSFMCSLGNTPSTEQISDLLPSVSHDCLVYICYDNDKYEPAISLLTKLRNLLPITVSVHLHLPPDSETKDWDEYIKKRGNKS